MIERLDIDGVHMDVTTELKKYVDKKIGRLDRYVPKHVRGGVHAEVKLKEGKGRGAADRTCEVIMHLPNDTITIKETTINMFAAIDIAETKLRGLLKKYKEKHANPKLHQRVIAKIKHRIGE